MTKQQALTKMNTPAARDQIVTVMAEKVAKLMSEHGMSITEATGIVADAYADYVAEACE